MTEIKLPTGWRYVTLAEVIEEIGDGGTPSTKNKSFFEGNIPWVNVSDIQREIIDTERHLSQDGVESCSTKIWDAGTIIFSFGATIGRVGIARTRLCTKQGIAGIVPNSDEIDNEYLYYVLLQASPRVQQLGQSMGSTIKEVRPPLLKKLIAFPKPDDIAEQKRIVQILTNIDDAIDKVDVAIEKTERVKIGLINKFYREDLDQGSLVPLDTVFEVIAGTTPDTKEKKYWENPTVNWITPADLGKMDGENTIAESERKITEIAVKKKNLTIMPPETIVMSTRAPVGHLAILKAPSTFNQGCKALLPLKGKKANPSYYLYYLLSRNYDLQNRAGQSTFKELSKTMLERFEIPEIDIKEQDKIAAILLSIDKKLSLEKQKRAKLERIKKGVMYDLLTGKKRLKVK